MRIVEYNGREIKTNLGGGYPFCDGNGKKTMTMFLPKTVLTAGDKYAHIETDDEMFNRIAGYGYTRITFYYTTTMIRGLYKTIAFAK